MASELGNRFNNRIAAAESRLRNLDEATAAEPFRPGGWKRKEVLGHLLDSAANNHVRFAAAALAGRYEGPKYDQTGWVALHGYEDQTWEDLLNNWRQRNQVLTRLVTRIPESALDSPCRIGDGSPVTLQFLIEDYLNHLDHHITQITTTTT